MIKKFKPYNESNNISEADQLLKKLEDAFQELSDLPHIDVRVVKSPIYSSSDDTIVWYDFEVVIEFHRGYVDELGHASIIPFLKDFYSILELSMEHVDFLIHRDVCIDGNEIVLYYK